MKKFFKWVGNIADDVLAYILTMVGILYKNTEGIFNGEEAFTNLAITGKLVSSLVIALLITLWQENLAKDDEGLKVKSREGRRKKFIQRMLNALLFGLGSTQIIDALMKTI